MPPAAAMVGGGAILGGVAGAIPDKSKTTSGVTLTPESYLERLGIQYSTNQLSNINDLVNSGAGTKDVTKATETQRALADMYAAFAKTGGLPGQEDIATAQGFAKNIFQNQQEALKQSFVGQTTEANRLAAQLGRSIDDPILQAKLRTNLMNQQAQLSAEEGSYASQLALQLPQQRLQYAGGQADILNNLATQAFNNRSALLSLGSNIAASERNFRLGTSERYGTTESGGGFGGAIKGAMAGAGAGMSMASMMGGFGGAGAPGSLSSQIGSANLAGNIGFGAAPQMQGIMAPAPTPYDRASANVFGGSSSGSNRYSLFQ